MPPMLNQDYPDDIFGSSPSKVKCKLVIVDKAGSFIIKNDIKSHYNDNVYPKALFIFYK